MGKKKHPTEKVGRNPQIEVTKTETAITEKKIEVKDAGNTQSKSFAQKVKTAPVTFLTWVKGLNRNTKLAASLVLILLIVGSVAFFATRGSESPQELANEEQPEEIEKSAPLGAAVTLAEGTLETKDEEGNWVDAPDELQPIEGTALRTVGAASRAIVTFDDGSALRLDANTEVEMISMTVERVVVRHISGYTYNRVVESESRSYIIESEDAQYEALGTAFKTASSGDEQAVEVFQSTVHETILNKKPTEGEKLTVKNNIDPTKDGEIEKLDIEEIKQDQFIQWNIEQDEKDENFKDKLGFLSDTEAPEIEITNPADGATVLLDPSATKGSVEFTGKTERSARVTVQSKSESGSQPVDVTVGDDGSFTTPVITAPLGSSVFEFVVKDRKGNTATKNVRVNFQRKSAPVTSTQDGIALSASLKEDVVKLNWKLLGNLKEDDGFKVVWNETGSPEYPSDNPQLTSDYSKSISGLSKGTYYFRVCIYDSKNNTCSNYSNQEKVTVD